ncbi:MAG: BsuPI-related putative proteinase inhibitor [Bryobacteraceae bacterium]
MTRSLLSAVGAAMFAATVAAASPDFFPLANGNSWTYRDAVTGQTFDVKVSLPIQTNDKVYHFVTGLGPNRLMLRQNEFGNLVYWDQEKETELIFTAFESAAPVAGFEAYGRQCPATGRALPVRADYAGPAGRWSAQVVEFQAYACADAGELSEQYVENVGMVRRVAQTFVGPRTFDLVYARVGKQIITAGDAGSFSVTALTGSDGASWDATLRLDLPSSIQAKFPSSQDYDLRLIDSDGNSVWSWSADKLFLQAQRTVNLGKFSATVKVPFPPAIPEGGHAYVLEAWLTTSQAEPQFAGATTLVLLSPARSAATDGSRRR